jgi:hypothetical protein
MMRLPAEPVETAARRPIHVPSGLPAATRLAERFAVVAENAAGRPSDIR